MFDIIKLHVKFKINCSIYNFNQRFTIEPDFLKLHPNSFKLIKPNILFWRKTSSCLYVCRNSYTHPPPLWPYLNPGNHDLNKSKFTLPEKCFNCNINPVPSLLTVVQSYLWRSWFEQTSIHEKRVFKIKKKKQEYTSL